MSNDTKYKVGDSVKCISYVEGLTYNKWYEIKEITANHYKVVRDDGYWQWQWKHIFQEVNEMTIEINPKAKPKKADTKPQANVFYVRRVGTVTEKVVHKTFEDARNEANRLAELTPNHEFQVLAVAYTVKKVPVYTTEAQEYHV